MVGQIKKFNRPYLPTPGLESSEGSQTQYQSLVMDF